MMGVGKNGTGKQVVGSGGGGAEGERVRRSNDSGSAVPERWTPSFGQGLVTAKVESGVHLSGPGSAWRSRGRLSWYG